MANIILVGAQWGDEGKGKVIDLLTEESDIIVRYQGGANAGHTVKFGDQQFILHLIPSGILRRNKICVIGNGVVIDPEALFGEIKYLKANKVKIDGRLFISEGAHLVFPYHKRLDALREEAKKGKHKIGTTKRGIGPCYADKMSRLGIRVVDLLDKDEFRERLKFVIAEKNDVLQKLYRNKGFSFNEVYKKYLDYRRKLLKYAVNTTYFLNQQIDRGKKLLFEGAQGTLLDVDHGTYPFVTSSNASVGGAITGTGVSPRRIDEIIGVVKAYTTRVGEGPLPTEFPPSLMKKIREKGEEFGATTGRPRRCGWFDAVIVRHSVIVNGIDKLAITKLDVLDELSKIKVCVGYRYGEKLFKTFPYNMKIFEKCTPVYEEHDGWMRDTQNIKKYGDLPKNAKKYLKRLSDLVGAPIALVSVGSLRSQTIFV